MLDFLLSITIWTSIVGILILATLVFRKNQKGKVNITLSLLAASTAFWSAGLFFFEHPVIISSFLWLKIVYLIVLFMVIFFFLLSFVFPQKQSKPFLIPLVIYLIIAAFFAYLILFTDLFLVGVTLKEWGHEQILGPAYPFFGVFMSAVAGWAIVNYILSYKKATGIEKLQLKFLFLGMFFFAVIPITLDVIFPVLLHNSRYIWFSPIGASFLTVAVSYSILKHRLLDISILVIRGVSYFLFLATLTLLFVTLVFISFSLLPISLYIEQLYIFIPMGLITAVFHRPLLRLFEKTTDKMFFKARYDKDELLRSLSQTTASTLTLSTLTYEILDLLCKQIRISKATFVLSLNDKLYIVESRHDKKRLEFTKKELERLKTGKNIVVFEELEEGGLKNLLRKKEILISLPLATKEHFIGLLLLGEKSSGDIYYDRDIGVMEIIGPELAVALQNAQRFEEISQFNKTLQGEINRATKNLQSANKRLKELDKLKDEFISVASHELRTPMSVIKSHLYMILKQEKELTKKAKERLKHAFEATERSITLVNEMLDVSRIEGGRLELNPEKFNLTKFAADIAGNVRIQAKDKQIKLTLSSDRNTDYFVKADKDKVLQVFNNLLNNAIKFTPEKGSVTISLKKTDNKIETAITDTGIGIKEKDFSKLFTKFGRLDASLSSVSENPGTGLGLYISKKLIELTGGEIKVKSRIGNGSTFTFTLPEA